MADKPIFKTRAGNISASVFRNKIKGKDGKADFEMDSISLQRSYKDSKDEWQNDSISLRKNDIIKLQLVLQEVAKQQFSKEDSKEE